MTGDLWLHLPEQLHHHRRHRHIRSQEVAKQKGKHISFLYCVLVCGVYSWSWAPALVILSEARKQWVISPVILLVASSLNHFLSSWFLEFLLLVMVAFLARRIPRHQHVAMAHIMQSRWYVPLAISKLMTVWICHQNIWLSTFAQRFHLASVTQTCW